MWYEFNRFSHLVFEGSANSVGDYTLEGPANSDSLLKHGCIIRDPYQTNQIQRFEKIQKLLVRYILNRYRQTESISQMINDVRLETLE